MSTDLPMALAVVRHTRDVKLGRTVTRFRDSLRALGTPPRDGTELLGARAPAPWLGSWRADWDLGRKLGRASRLADFLSVATVVLCVGVVAACSTSEESSSPEAPDTSVPGPLQVRLDGAGCLPESVLTETSGGSAACGSLDALLDAFAAGEPTPPLPPLTWLLGTCAGPGAAPESFAELCDEAVERLSPIDPQVDEARTTCSVGASNLLAAAFGREDVTPELAIFGLSEAPHSTADDAAVNDARALLAGEPGPFVSLDRYLASCYARPVVDPAVVDRARQLLEMLSDRGLALDSDPVASPLYPRGDVQSGAESRLLGHTVELLVFEIASQADDLVAAMGGPLQFSCGSIVFNIILNSGSANPAELERATAQAHEILIGEDLCGDS